MNDLRIIEAPVPAILRKPPSPTSGVDGSVTMWASVGEAMRRGRRSPVVEVMLPRTLPVLTMDDLMPYHFIEQPDGLSLRKGAPPKAVAGAAADFAEGHLDLNGFLDRIGVPRS